MRRRDESSISINTNCRDRHSGAGSPCCRHRNDTNAAAAAAADDDDTKPSRKPYPTGRLRLYLAASALALCTVTLLLQETLGRAALRESHAPAVSSVQSSSGRGAGGAAAGAAKAKAKANANAEIDLDSLPYRLDEGGPELPWVPPAERPIPLDAFPVFNGHGFKANGKLDLVDEEVAVTNVAAAPAGGLSVSSGGGGAVSASNEEGGPAAGEVGTTTSTLLFMHIWKCAGSSLRHLLRDWASLKGQDIGVVVRCNDIVSEEKEKICMQRHALVNETAQAPYVRRKQVVAGHFTWGFQKHVQQPYVMFTTLRNPLELFVSGQQYLNREESKHFAHAVSLVEETMMSATRDHVLRGGVMTREGMGNRKSVGFIHRLADPVRSRSSDEGDEGPKTLDTAAREAKEHLDTFWLVGAVEQYKGFIAVLKHMMDPLKSERKLWQKYAVGKYNTSPQGAGKVLAAINPALVQQFNETLSHQWDVYSYAVELYKHRCKQILHTRKLELCEVPVAPSRYTLTDLERAELNLKRTKLP